MVHTYVCLQHLRPLSDQSDQDLQCSHKHSPEYLPQKLSIRMIVDNTAYHDQRSLLRITDICPKSFSISDILISKGKNKYSVLYSRNLNLKTVVSFFILRSDICVFELHKYLSQTIHRVNLITKETSVI